MKNFCQRPTLGQILYRCGCDGPISICKFAEKDCVYLSMCEFYAKGFCVNKEAQNDADMSAERNRILMDEKQAGANLIRRELDLNLAILITVDRNGALSMSAASRDSDQAAKASVLLSQLSDVLFSKRGSLASKQPANKHPI